MRLVLENVRKRVGAEHHLDRLSTVLIPRALVIWFVRNYIAKGFAMGRV
jgi:hypothetical protein